MQSTRKSLTLIVAATPTLGIGRNGTLPWPSLKQEMAYFANVTKRQPNTAVRTINAVIMGRRTWDSIPSRFRPLKDRLNVVITRNTQLGGDNSTKEGPVIVGSLDQALEILENTVKEEETAEAGARTRSRDIGDIFVIGGSSIYAAALEHRQTRRVLLTKISSPDYECDTFFPVDLDGEEAGKQGWSKRSGEKLKKFVGIEALSAKQESDGTKRKEGDVKWEYCMYEREETA